MCSAWCFRLTSKTLLAQHAYRLLTEEPRSMKRYLSSISRTQKNSDYCVSLVKRCDYENYLCLLLVGTAFRHPAFVIRAANVEIASVMDSVSVHQTAAGRFAFWRDCVDRASSPTRVVNHPVAEELGLVMTKFKLSKMWFSKLITSRERLLKEAHMQSIKDVEAYAEDTCSSINYLLLEAAGIRKLSADHAASHLGKCQGIINLLRGTKYLASKNVTYFPQDLLLEHHISQEDVLQGRNAGGIKEVVHELYWLANSHLEKFHSESKELPPVGRTLCLSHVACALALNNIKKCDFDIRHADWNIKLSTLPWMLWRASKNF